jgi:DNA-binding MarR family transcriptional regulator
MVFLFEKYVYLQFANRESKIIQMNKHNGMRPQDVVVLLKIARLKDQNWLGKDLATALFISPSEVSESLNRSSFAGLLDADKRKLMRQAFLEFLEHGFKFVFPIQPGPIVRGMPTAHSAPPLNKVIQSQEFYVWPDALGEQRGQAIEPLHPGVVKAAKVDSEFYELLSLIDALRIGKAREQQIALKELKNRLGYTNEKKN